MNAVSCPNVGALAELLDDDTAETGTVYFEHLETCRLCQQTLAELAADQASWTEVALNLPQVESQLAGPQASEPALAQVMVQLKAELSLLTQAAPAADEEDLSLSFLRQAERPGLLGYLGDYEVLEVIGRGGMGIVFKAFDPLLHRLVAIKVMASAALVSSVTSRQRFKREAQAAAAVCHDHIVTVHGVHEKDGWPYLVMQYIAGESLQTRLDRTGPLEVTEIVRIGLQTASGLAAAHAQGLIHRDIKPANLLLENGLARVKITDFGLARMADDVQLTQNGELAGTPEYMAPEQTSGGKVDLRADLFSMGSVLYAMCTGRPPFRGSSPLAVIRQVADQDPHSIRDLNPEVPAWLETFIARLMAKEPEDRFQSAAEVAQLLEGYLAHLRQPATVPAPKLPSSLLETFRSIKAWWPLPWLLAGVLLATLTLGNGLVLLYALQSPPQPQAQKPVLPRTFYQDFRNRRLPADPVLTSGPNFELVAHAENEGLRITLPAGRSDSEPVGIVVTSAVAGDFEITSGYELLDWGPSKAGNLLGVELYLMTDTPTQESVALYRGVRGKEGDDMYMCVRMTGPRDKRRYAHNFVPAAGKSGQLRATRSGNEITFWAAEDAQSDFRELWHYELNIEDVKIVRMAAYTSRVPEPVDVRILDLKIRAKDMDIEQALDSSVQTLVPSDTLSRGWIVMGGMAGLLLLGGIMAGVVVVLRRRRPAGKLSPATMLVERRDESSPAGAVVVSFSCANCGKSLKAKGELAGKKVKCTQCAQPVAVPSIMAT